MDHQVAYLPVAYKIFVLGVTLMLLAWTILTWCVNFPPHTWHWRWNWRWWWWCRHPQSHLPSGPLADRHRGSSKRNDDHHPDHDKSPAKPHKTRKKQTKHSEGPRRWLAPKPGSWLLEWASGKWHRDEGKPIDKPSKYASPPGRPTTSMATTTNSRGGGEPENDAGLANGNAPEWVTISLAGAKGQWDEEEYFHHNQHDHNQHHRKDDDDDDDEGVRTRDSNVRDDAAVLPDAWPLPVPASRPRSPAPPPAAVMSAVGSSRTQAIATGFHTPGPGSAIRHLARQTPVRPPSPENPYIPPVSMRPRTSEEWVLDREAFFSPKAAPPRVPSPAPSTLAPTPTPAQGQAPAPAPNSYARSSRHSQAAQSLFVGSTAENPLTFIARPYDAYTYDVEALDATSSSHRSTSAASGSKNNLASTLAAGSQHRREHSAGSWLDLVDDAVTWGAAKFAEFTDDDGDDTELLPISNPMMMKGKSD
ncbi:hypothetical protein BS50DRAFT_567327 [Corynespora cassiicola Philippines]|uniref:Uncharacterized protein n=1 Tax=Corynespora cassiicola Philippines TaxID=1448308 RepID=A0A2T2PA10_CORCC|nr:hypothetical protein BS50DRAFT_567327 [Corynespora cassiicola Philippines]